jgi:hypothetical protein
MPTNSYDLIVIGDDLAGLAAAALCARRGMRTLVLGHHDRPWRYQLGPHKLPVEHTSIVSRAGGAVERVVKDLGLEHALRRRQREVRTSAQLVAPGVRLDFPADADVLGRALTRELGADGAAVLAAWERAGDVARLADPLLGAEHAFPAHGFWERREVARLAARAETEAAAWWASAEESLAASPTMAHALALTALPSALGARAWPPAPLAIARALDGWRGGVPALRGDIDTLRELLIEKLTASTGELRAGRVAELIMSWGKITAVRLENGEELGAGQVIAAMPLAELVPLLGAKPPKRALEMAAPLAVAGWRYTLNLVIDDGGVPEGMAPTVLAVRDPDEAPSGSNAYALHVGEADDGGRVVVTVSAVLPAPDDGVSADPAWMARALAALRKGLLASIDDVMPFIASHVMIAHSPHEATPPVVTGKGTFEAPRTLPVPPRPLWRAPAVEASAGLSAAPYAPGVKNLTIGSTQILPHLGLEGDLAAGWSAAKIAHAIAGKKKDYLRDEVLSPT